MKAPKAIRHLTVILFLLAAPHPHLTAAASSQEPYRDNIALFFQGIMKGDVEGSFRSIISESLIEGKPQEISYLIRQTKNALAVYGDIEDYKHLETECMAERVCLSRYISFSKNYPMLWRFIFYRRDEGWVLLHISFNDSVKTFFHLE